MTLDDLLGPDWRSQVAGYSYHGNVGLTNGGAVPLTTTGGQSGFLQQDPDTGAYTFFSPTGGGDSNVRFDSGGNMTGQDQTSQFSDAAGIATVLGVAAGGALLGGGAGGAGADSSVMDAAAASDAGGGSLGGAATGFDSTMEAAAASDAGGGSLGGAATGFDGGLGGGMNAEDFSFGADAAGGGAGGTLSSLGSALAGGGGATGFGSLLPLISGLVGASDARKSGNTANDLANRLIQASDPFSKYRAGYGQKLQDLEASHDVTTIPGYQAGLEAVQRSGAAEGFTGSGNMMKSLQDYGGNFYNSELTRLAHLAGADQTPGAGFATGAGLIGAGQKQSAFGNQQTIQAIGSAGNFLQGLGQQGFGGDSSVGNPMPETGEMV